MDLNLRIQIFRSACDGVRRLNRTVIVVTVVRSVGGADIVLGVGKRIRELRKEKGLTQEELAAKLGIATKNVQRLESGKQNLTLKTLKTVSDALGVEPRALLEHATFDATDDSGALTISKDLEPLEEAGFDLLPAHGEKRPRGSTPVMSLHAAASSLGGAEAVEILAWLRPRKRAPFPAGSLIVQVVGESMEPLVPAGSWCLLKTPVLGALEGRIVLVEHRSLADPDTGGSYALKKIAGFEARAGGRFEVRLESVNPRYDPITVPIERMDELRALAELDRVLIERPGTKKRSRT